MEPGKEDAASVPGQPGPRLSAPRHREGLQGLRGAQEYQHQGTVRLPGGEGQAGG